MTIPATRETSDSAQSGRSLDPAVWLAMGVCVLSALLLLKFMGRPWWCACGGWSLWSGEVNSQHNSQHLFDHYSATHVLHGFLFWWGLHWLSPRVSERWLLPAAVLLETVWELAENSPVIINRYRTATLALGYEGDSVLNSLCDILCAAVGFVLARRLGWTWGLAFFVVVELVVVWLIRDNLTLNILMLVVPLPRIKAWQMGG
jgi:hypothetical protein